MGRQGRSHVFLEHWHPRDAVLPDGHVLRWLVVARPGTEPFIAYFRRDGAGGVHEDEGFRLLAELGHADTAISRRGSLVGRSLSR